MMGSRPASKRLREGRMIRNGPPGSGIRIRTGPIPACILICVTVFFAGCETAPPSDAPGDLALQHCQAELDLASRANRLCDDSLLSAQSRLDSVRNARHRLDVERQTLVEEHQQLEREYRNLESGHRELLDAHDDLRQTLDRERSTSERMRAIFRELEKEIESRSLLLYTPEQLKELEVREIARLKRYREAERDLDREASRERSSILSLLFPGDSSDSIDWDPEYLQKRIAEVETSIRLIRYARILISGGGTRLEDIL